MSFERSYGVESHERIKQILNFFDKSLLLPWWVTYALNTYTCIKNHECQALTYMHNLPWLKRPLDQQMSKRQSHVTSTNN